MASVNKVILIGNLGRDPEIRYAQDNSYVIGNLNLATTRRYKDSQGQITEETEWHRVVLFGRQAELAQQYLHKGNSVYVEGRLRTRKWTDKNGVDRYTTEIVCETMQFLGGPRAQGAYQPGQNQAAPGGYQQGASDGFESPRRPAVSRPNAQPAAPQTPAVTSADTLSEDDVPF